MVIPYTLLKMNNLNIAQIYNQLPQTGRAASQRFVINKLYERFNFNPIVIVETGCIRNDKDSCDGWGTLCWRIWAENTKSRVYSVDMSRISLANCKNIVDQSPFVNYIYSDSIKFLNNLPENFKIDFLFLDSYDYSENDEENCIKHQLNEVKACENKLKENSLILIDDIFNTKDFKGKGKLAIPYLLDKGWKIINYANTQILLSK